MARQGQFEALPLDLGLEECALCGSDDPLHLSHIVPSFVIRRLRSSAVTGGLRAAETPNLRRQDAWKTRLLCTGCEEMLGRWEQRVATKLFHPFHDADSARLTYGPYFSRFVASVCWRALFVYRERFPLGHLSADQLALVGDALDRWRRFMLEETQHVAGFQLHVLPLGPVEGGPVSEFPPNINRYFLRAVDVDIVSGERTAFVYAKLMRFALFGMLQYDETEWEGTGVALKQGAFGGRNYVVPEALFDFLMGRAKKAGDILANMSDRQKDRISADVKKNRDRVPGSDLAEAVLADIALFGNRAFEWPVD